MDSTLEYYNRHARELAESPESARLDLAALREFTSRLPAQARVLDAGCGFGRDLAYFSRQGLAAEGFDGASELVQIAATRAPLAKVWQADFMLLSLPRDRYDGIWAHRSLIHLPPPGVQRTLALFFSALKPRGALFVSLEEGPTGELEKSDSGPWIYRYAKDDFASLLRQSGFQTESIGHVVAVAGAVAGDATGEPTRQLAFVARRI